MKLFNEISIIAEGYREALLLERKYNRKKVRAALDTLTLFLGLLQEEEVKEQLCPKYWEESTSDIRTLGEKLQNILNEEVHDE